MFKREKDINKIDYHHLNKLIYLSTKFVKLLYSISILCIIVLLLALSKQLKLFDILGEILSILSPLFIGIIIAWLLDPIVSFMQSKGVKRGIGVITVYFVLIGFFIIIGSFIVPQLGSQINDMITSAPSTIDNLTNWINHLIYSFSDTYGLDSAIIKENVYAVASNIFKSLTVDGPTMIFRIGKAIFSGGLNIIIGFLIAIYLLIDFDRINKRLSKTIPKKNKAEIKDLTDKLNQTLRNYVYGTLIVMFILFICQSVGMSIAGMKAPMVFGLFCAVTNIIPYLGPYIGGIPSIIVGFTISPQVGLGVTTSVLVCQGLESYLLTPTVMSKTMKLHPVTIIIGLLLFGHFFGILGMLFATPIISCCKIFLIFIIKKYHLFKLDDDENKHYEHDEDIDLIIDEIEDIEEDA